MKYLLLNHHPTLLTFSFLLSFEGTRLRPDDSVLTIPDLENGDTIDVFTQQQGGGGGGAGQTSDVPQ